MQIIFAIFNTAVKEKSMPLLRISLQKKAYFTRTVYLQHCVQQTKTVLPNFCRCFVL